MVRTRKRNPDLRQIRISKTYSLPEIAILLGIHVATVRSWVRQGLPILGDQRPVLVFGHDLKTWLQARRVAKRQKCKPGELFCFKCRQPRRPEPASVQITPRNEKTVSIKGRCGLCGTRMYQAGSRARIADIKEQFGVPTPHMPHLEEYGNASDRVTFEQNTVFRDFKGSGEAQTALNPGVADQNQEAPGNPRRKSQF